jgi:hypothetical protein
MLIPLCLLLTANAAAHDDHVGADHNQISGVRFDIHANLDPYGMFGAGARFELPLVPNGFIGGKVHDELALSLGADLLFGGTYLGWSDSDPGTFLTPLAAVQWNFYFGNNWSIFPEAGLAIHIGFTHDTWYDGRGHAYGWLYPQPELGLGARYHFNPNLALLMRVSTPAGLQVGLVF